MSIAPVPLAFFAGGNVTAMYGRNYIKNVFGVLGTMAKPVMLLLYLSSLSAIIKGADNMTHKLLGFV